MAKRKKEGRAPGAAALDKPVEWRDESRDLSEQRSDATDEAIAVRAYEIYCERGGADGRALDDWLQAEAELSQRNVPKGEAPLIQED